MFVGVCVCDYVCLTLTFGVRAPLLKRSHHLALPSTQQAKSLLVTELQRSAFPVAQTRDHSCTWRASKSRWLLYLLSLACAQRGKSFAVQDANSQNSNDKIKERQGHTGAGVLGVRKLREWLHEPRSAA